MVKRYDLITMGKARAYEECYIDEIPPNCQIEGNFVTIKDYLALQSALREALDGWDKWRPPGVENPREHKRITELRKQFLES